jgi:hypothetical protein
MRRVPGGWRSVLCRLRCLAGAAVAALGAETGVMGLAARAGVVAAEMAVTLGAVGEGMVAGDAVNTAARVQTAAESGQVLVDAATQRLAGGAVGFADAGEHALKGKAEPARLWRATRVLAGVGGSQRVDGLAAPLRLSQWQRHFVRQVGRFPPIRFRDRDPALRDAGTGSDAAEPKR